MPDRALPPDAELKKLRGLKIQVEGKTASEPRHTFNSEMFRNALFFAGQILFVCVRVHKLFIKV